MKLKRDIPSELQKAAEQQAAASPQHFLNRELSWLEFNARVLAQAADSQTPLLERIFFLGIFSSNLDEFFMKRVGGLKRQIMAGISVASRDGLTPKETIQMIRSRLQPMLAEQGRLFEQEIQPALRQEKIIVLRWDDLDEQEQKLAGDYFYRNLFPVLTPLAVDARHPFPFISNLSTSLGLKLANIEDQDEPLFARVKISGLLPQLVQLHSASHPGTYRFIGVLDLVMQHVQDLFPGMNLLGCMPFRITRNADLEVNDDDADDLLELIEESLRQRRFSEAVRLEHGPNPDPWILSFLTDRLSLSADDVYERKGELDYTAFSILTKLELPHLKFHPWTPVTPPALAEEPNIFAAIKQRDVLVHHPYDSFGASVERFVREAVHDPKVLSIKMTVYRVGDQTPVIPLLAEAAAAGKHVVCLVELKARFDEERNIHWAQALEEAGVHVVYGIPGLKTHAKTLLIARSEDDGVRCYAHIGTGNYHAMTANLYTDLGLFTAKPEYTSELMHFFNFLTGRSLQQSCDKLLIAPLNMEQRLLELIDTEIAHAAKGKNSGL